jgi:hypothetical protein
MPVRWPRPRCPATLAAPVRSGLARGAESARGLGSARGAGLARGVGIAFAAALIGGAGPASATEPVRFAWVRGEGAEGCAAQQPIADAVTARLGEGAIASSAGRSIEAVVSRVERGFRVVLYVRAADGSLSGSREITSESERCASIEAASVLAIALAIDPDAATRPPPAAAPPSALSVSEETPPSLSASPSSPPPAPPAPPAPAPAPPRRAAVPAVPRAPAPLALATDTSGAGVTLRAGPGFGLLPSPSPAFSLAGHVALTARVEITAEALWMPEARTADKRFAFGLTALSLGVCRTLSRARVYDLGVCGAVWGGALHAVVFDLLPEAPGDYAWAAASIAPHLRIRAAPHLHLDLGVQVIVPFVRRSFQVSGWKDPVFQEAPVTLLPFGGAGIHFL